MADRLPGDRLAHRDLHKPSVAKCRAHVPEGIDACLPPKRSQQRLEKRRRREIEPEHVVTRPQDAPDLTYRLTPGRQW